MKILITLFICCCFIGMAFAQDYLEEEDISQIVVKKALILNQVVISDDNAEIKTIAKFFDAEDNEIGEKRGPSFRYWNIEDDPDTEEDETCTDFTVFMQKLGLNGATIKQAVIEMETE